MLTALGYGLTPAFLPPNTTTHPCLGSELSNPCCVRPKGIAKFYSYQGSLRYVNEVTVSTLTFCAFLKYLRCKSPPFKPLTLLSISGAYCWEPRSPRGPPQSHQQNDLCINRVPATNKWYIHIRIIDLIDNLIEGLFTKMWEGYRKPWRFVQYSRASDIRMLPPWPIAAALITWQASNRARFWVILLVSCYLANSFRPSSSQPNLIAPELLQDLIKPLFRSYSSA